MGRKLKNKIFQSRDLCLRALDTNWLCAKSSAEMRLKMNLQTVHHIAIIGSDYEKSKHFYVEQLGFSVIRENYRAERDDYKIDLQLNGMELELFIIKNCPKRPSYPEAYGLRHLAFAVESVEQTVRELEEKGIATDPIRVEDYTGPKMPFFYDPDGLPLVIHE